MYTATEKEIEKFCDKVDFWFPTLKPEITDNRYLDQFDLIFDPENWLSTPISYKGTWIVLDNDKGQTELHFAKKTNGTKVPQQALPSILEGYGYVSDKNKLETEFGKKARNFSPLEKKQLNISVKLTETITRILQEQVDLIHTASSYKLQIARIQQTKTKVKYLLPTQYEIASDNILRLFDYVGKSPHIKFTRYFMTPETNDQIFYMQQRGIEKEQASMLVSRQQGFLTIDIENIFNTPDPITITHK